MSRAGEVLCLLFVVCGRAHHCVVEVSLMGNCTC